MQPSLRRFQPHGTRASNRLTAVSAPYLRAGAVLRKVSRAAGPRTCCYSMRAVQTQRKMQLASTGEQHNRTTFDSQRRRVGDARPEGSLAQLVVLGAALACRSSRAGVKEARAGEVQPMWLASFGTVRAAPLRSAA